MRNPRCNKNTRLLVMHTIPKKWTKLNRNLSVSTPNRSERSVTSRRVSKLIIPKAPFKRIVTDEVCELGGPDMRVRKDALEAFQTGAEAYLIGMFQDVNLIAIRAHRETVHPRDVALWKSITSDKNI